MLSAAKAFGQIGTGKLFVMIIAEVLEMLGKKRLIIEKGDKMDNKTLVQAICDLLLIKNKSVIADMFDEVEELENRKKFFEFVVEYKDHINDRFKEVDGAKKFRYLMRKFNSVDENGVEYWEIIKFVSRLQQKLVILFNEVYFLHPTPEQIESLEWKRLDIFTKTEIELCDLIGNTSVIYNLATRNRNKLFDELKDKSLDSKIVKRKDVIDMEAERIEV